MQKEENLYPIYPGCFAAQAGVPGVKRTPQTLLPRGFHGATQQFPVLPDLLSQATQHVWEGKPDTKEGQLSVPFFFCFHLFPVGQCNRAPVFSVTWALAYGNLHPPPKQGTLPASTTSCKSHATDTRLEQSTTTKLLPSLAKPSPRAALCLQVDCFPSRFFYYFKFKET